MKKYPVNAALEAAVIANAEDDTPRLVYADWLDENGDPDRAAFIRTQVALWDKNAAEADYPDLLERRVELDSKLFSNTTVRFLTSEGRARRNGLFARTARAPPSSFGK